MVFYNVHLYTFIEINDVKLPLCYITGSHDYYQDYDSSSRHFSLDYGSGTHLAIAKIDQCNPENNDDLNNTLEELKEEFPFIDSFEKVMDIKEHLIEACPYIEDAICALEITPFFDEFLTIQKE